MPSESEIHAARCRAQKSQSQARGVKSAKETSVSRFQRSAPQWQPPVWEWDVIQVTILSKWPGDDQGRL